MRLRRGLACVVLLGCLLAASGACGGASAARSGVPGARGRGGALASAVSHGDADDAAAPEIGRRAPLRYELRGRPFPLPLVRGTVAGEPTWMLVDTGANSHVIAGWLARKAKLEVKNVGDLGTDHTGRTISTSRVEKHHVRIDGWGALADQAMLVTEVPEAVARLGIGVFISPQQLGGEDGAVVLDLARGELAVVAASQVARTLEGRGLDPFHPAPTVCEDEGSPVHGLAYVAEATLDGSKLGLLLDSGAQHSDLLAGRPVAKRFARKSVANKEQVYAASGRVTTRTIKGARLKLGALTHQADLDVVPGDADPTCPRDGALSMDFLRACVLVLERERVQARCDLPQK